MVEAGEVGHEVSELVGDGLRVIGLLLQLIDLVLDCPLLLLQPGLLLGDLLYLGVGEGDHLGGALGAEQPVRELLRLGAGEILRREPKDVCLPHAPSLPFLMPVTKMRIVIHHLKRFAAAAALFLLVFGVAGLWASGNQEMKPKKGKINLGAVHITFEQSYFYEGDGEKISV